MSRIALILALCCLVACGGAQDPFPGRDSVVFPDDESKHGDVAAAEEAGLIRYAPMESWAVYLPGTPRVTNTGDLVLVFSMSSEVSANLLIRLIKKPKLRANPDQALRQNYAENLERRKKRGKVVDYPVRWFTYLGMPAYDEFSPGDYGPEMSRTVAVGDAIVTMMSMHLEPPSGKVIEILDTFYNSLTKSGLRWVRFDASSEWSASFPGIPKTDARPSGVTIHTFSDLPKNAYVVSESRGIEGQRTAKEAIESSKERMDAQGAFVTEDIVPANVGGVDGFALTFHSKDGRGAGVISTFRVGDLLLMVETRWRNDVPGSKATSDKFLGSFKLHTDGSSHSGS